MSDRLVLVTGGSGYIGSVLVPIVAKLYPVRVYETMTFGNPIAGTPNCEFIQGDIRDYSAVRKALEGVTDVIHLAGIVTDDLVDMNQNMAREVNNQAMYHLCWDAVAAGVKRFIYASSSSVYGTQDDVCTEGYPTRPMTEYANTKLVGEYIVGECRKDMTTVSIRSATACGPAPRMRLDTIVNIFSAQAYFKGEITVHGGDQYRTNIHVKDIANLYCRLLDADAKLINGEVFNATASNLTALIIAEMVSDLVACKITVDASKADNRHYRMSAVKLREALNWHPEFTIHDAIVDNLQFFAAGGIKDWQDDIYFNTKRMESTVKAELNKEGRV